MSDRAHFDYEDRYGTKRTSHWIVYATVLALLGGTWVIWAGLHHSNPGIRTTLISFQPVDEKTISIRYEMTRNDKNKKVTCTLIARDYDKNIVGQIDDLIDVGNNTVTREVLIPARAKPVNAAVSRCRAL